MKKFSLRFHEFFKPLEKSVFWKENFSTDRLQINLQTLNSNDLFFPKLYSNFSDISELLVVVQQIFANIAKNLQKIAKICWLAKQHKYLVVASEWL